MSRHSISDSAAAERGQLVLVACLQPGADDMHPASVKRCWPSCAFGGRRRGARVYWRTSLSSGQTGEHRAGRRPAGPGRLAEAGWQGSAWTGLDFWLLRDGPGPGRGHLPGTPPGASARPLGGRRCCWVIVSVRPGSGVCSPSLPGVAGSWSSVAGPVRRAGWPGPLPLAVVRNQPRVADRRHDGRRSDRLDPAPVPDGCCGPADVSAVLNIVLAVPNGVIPATPVCIRACLRRSTGCWGCASLLAGRGRRSGRARRCRDHPQAHGSFLPLA